MKIEGGNPFKVLGAYLRTDKGVKKGGEAAPVDAQKSSDRIEISEKSVQIERLSKMVSKGSDIREDRILSAQKSLASGKVPSARAMAESLVKSAVMDKIV
ncbi:MAG: hypothetical protein AAB300_01235 [Nitrospirota bacterium]